MEHRIAAGLLLLLATALPGRADLAIAKSALPPAGSDVLLAVDTDAVGSQSFFTMARGGGSSGVGGGESAYGQTFRFDTPVRLEAITFKVRTKPGYDVSGAPLLLWFGKGFSGQTASGMSSLMVNEECDLPGSMATPGAVWYLTVDFDDQVLEASRTYGFLPRFASGGDGDHPELEVGFMGAYSYGGGAAFDIDYDTILNNEMVFFVHGSAVPEPFGTAWAVLVPLFVLVPRRQRSRRAIRSTACRAAL